MPIIKTKPPTRGLGTGVEESSVKSTIPINFPVSGCLDRWYLQFISSPFCETYTSGKGYMKNPETSHP
jgi:hypothetical protein